MEAVGLCDTDPVTLGIVCDLDGVVWDGRRILPGAVDGLRTLDDGGAEVWYVTNNSRLATADISDRLAEIGAPTPHNVLTSAEAAASLVPPGSRVLVVGGHGIHRAVEAYGSTPVAVADLSHHDAATMDAVVVGLDEHFDYHRLWVAQAAVLGGAMLIGANPDTSYPADGGVRPGGGSIVAAVAAASSTEPVIAGKPNEPMARLWRERTTASRGRIVMIGDRRATDGRFAQRLGAEFILITSAVSDHDRDDLEVNASCGTLAEAADWITNGG